MSGCGERPVPVPYAESTLPDVSLGTTKAMALYTVETCVDRRILGADLPATYTCRDTGHGPTRLSSLDHGRTKPGTYRF